MLLQGSLEGLSRGTCCGDWVWTDHVVPQPGQKTQAWVALSENAPKACLLLTGQDLPVLSCWISSLASGQGISWSAGQRGSPLCKVILLADVQQDAVGNKPG